MINFMHKHLRYAVILTLFPACGEQGYCYLKVTVLFFVFETDPYSCIMVELI